MYKKAIRLVCLVMVGVIASGLLWQQRNKPLCKDCNVILISLDTLSAKHLPCYGYDKNTAPNLCQFGKDNILFTNSYSQSNWTRPSQTSVLTGLHPSSHGVLTAYIDKLSLNNKTIQEVLKEGGYKTYYFGPHIDNDSWDKSVIRGFDVMKDDIYDKDTLDHWNKALNVLEQNQKNKQPTFMYLHTYYVHAPYITGNEKLTFVNEDEQKKYPEVPLTDEGYYKQTLDKQKFIINSLEERIKNSETKESLEKNVKTLNEMKKAKTVNESERILYTLPNLESASYEYTYYFNTFSKLNNNEYIRSLYDEKIFQLDSELKQFLDRIKNQFAKDTIVIIYSDHGETLGERGSYGHCYNNFICLYNEIIRVPLIIRVPGVENRKINELVQGIDIFPTILKLIGKEPSINLKGESLVGLIKNKMLKSEKKYVVSEDSGLQKTIVDEKWKIYFKDYKNITPDNVELYDLENDLYEQNNLVKEKPRVVEMKINQLNEFIITKKNVDLLRYNFPEWIDEIKKKKLVNEGYF